MTCGHMGKLSCAIGSVKKKTINYLRVMTQMVKKRKILAVAYKVRRYLSFFFGLFC